jgi:hypothetical protein
MFQAREEEGENFTLCLDAWKMTGKHFSVVLK